MTESLIYCIAKALRTYLPKPVDGMHEETRQLLEDNVMSAAKAAIAAISENDRCAIGKKQVSTEPVSTNGLNDSAYKAACEARTHYRQYTDVLAYTIAGEDAAFIEAYMGAFGDSGDTNRGPFDLVFSTLIASLNFLFSEAEQQVLFYSGLHDLTNVTHWHAQKLAYHKAIKLVLEQQQREMLLPLDEEIIAKGWFQKQVASAQKDVLAWPQWLKDHLQETAPAREISNPPEALETQVWLEDPRSKIMLAGWAAIQPTLKDHATQGYIRGWNIQPVPDAVRAQQFWEGLEATKTDIEGGAS